MKSKIYTAEEIEQMRRALVSKYGWNGPNSLDYQNMPPQKVVEKYESMMDGTDDYWSNERR